MRILERSVYVGPSLYAHFPVIRLELDLGALEQWPTGEARRRLSSTACSPRCPGLAEHGCSYREPGGFVRRMREDEGTWLGHVLEHVAIELQNVAGEDVTFGKTRSTDDGPACIGGLRVRAAARRASPRANSRCACSTRCCRASCARRGSVPEDWDWPTRARRVHPLRAAPRARSVDRLARARGRGARHPVAAPQRAVAGAARPRQVPAAHPGDGHRRARRTSRSSWRATRKRPTRSSARSACRCRSRSWCSTRGRRVARGAPARLSRS